MFLSKNFNEAITLANAFMCDIKIQMLTEAFIETSSMQRAHLKYQNY